MTIAPRVLFACAVLAAAAPAFADDTSDLVSAGGTPETITVASADSAAIGAEDHRITFVVVKAENGACYAVLPPGGEGIVAGDRYAVVAANDVTDAMRADLAKAHRDCKPVNVVARIAK
jgi:hypothetical protein